MPTINELQKLVASDQAETDQFGWSVAISGDGLTAVVCARTDDSPASDAGSAYVYINSGGTWSEQAKLVASDQAASDWFGYSVAISEDGNTIAVGAPYDDSPTSNAGSAYIFVRSGTSWSEQQKLTDTVQTVNDRYGSSVSLSSDGNTVIVGAMGDSSPAYQAGSAFVYTRSGVTWTLEQKLVASDQLGGDQFGWSVAISADGTTAIIGANYDYSPAYQAGSAYVFVRSGVTWTQQAKLTASDQAADDQFGCSVAISGDGNTAIIGAIGDDSPLASAGSAYVFTRSGTAWALEQKLVASDQAANDLFGQSVAISVDGNTAIIGAYGDGSPLNGAGSVYVFTRSGVTWTEQAKLVASDQAASDYLGYSVCLSSDGTIAIIGAYGDNSPLADAGSAYIFATGITPPASGVEPVILALSPLGYWKLNDAYNASVIDYSGNVYDGSWVGVSPGEDTQDDMLGDGVLGLKVSLAGINDTGYMENTAVLAAGNADTDSYTWIGWVKGFGETDCDVMSWYTNAVGSTKQYRGRMSLTSLGELRWNRIYQSGVDPLNDLLYQSYITSGLGLSPDTPYLIALRESATTTEILVNGTVIASLPRVGNTSLDTTYAPRDGLRVGNESTVTNGTQTHCSYVHSALFAGNLSDAQILSIYDAYSPLAKTGTIACDQSSQSGTGAANKTGTLSATGTITTYQEDAFLVDSFMVVTEFISQSASISATYVSPDNYITSNQVPQGMIITAVATGDPITYRFSTGGLTTTPDSTPANTPIAPRLTNPGNYKAEIDISDVGVIVPSFGQVVLDNKDGALDGLIDKAFDGGSYKLYYGPRRGKFPDDFVKVVDTIMGKPTFDNKSIKIQLKDKLDFLSLPLSEQIYTGLGGVGGDSNIQGATKSRVIGRVWSAPIQTIDETKLVYAVCTDRMYTGCTTNNYETHGTEAYRSTPKAWNDAYSTIAAGNVFDGGTGLENEADYASEADVFAIQPTAGKARWYRPASGNILFRLGSIPDKDLRVDVWTSPDATSDSWLVSDIIAERTDITMASGSEDPELIRGFVSEGSSLTYSDAVREFLKRGYYYARTNKDGEFIVNQIATPNPSDTSVYEFNESNMSSISIEQAIPAWKLFIKTGATSSSQTNTGISESRRKEFTDSSYHTEYSYENPAIKSRHRLSSIIDVSVNSWWNQDDIDDYVERTKVVLMEDRIIVSISVDRGLMNSGTLLLDIGDIVTVKMPRYNFDLGKKLYIHGVRHDYGTGKLNFTLWG